MRNLKRALSLALAAAMLISLMVVGASAAEYGDQAQVSQTEAVEVLTGLGVVGGDQNGNFNPTATLTRAEFCVMIANALTGGTFDRTLFDGATTPFTDVQGHWGQAYIAYCYSNGIIAGTSATTFSPDATLTAAQAAAILLMALGYNQNNEFAANGQFELNVTRWAQDAGLYAGLSVSATAGISRENTAKLIFNALTNTTPVNYGTLAQAYYTVGTSAVEGKVLSGDQLDPTVYNGAANYRSTLGYTNFGLIKQVNPDKDDFGRPTSEWGVTANAGSANPSFDETIATVANAPVATFTAATKANAVASALRGYHFSDGTEEYPVNDTDKYTNVYFTGNAAGSNILTTVSATGKTTNVVATDSNTACTVADRISRMTGNGVLVEVYADSDKEISAIVIVDAGIAEVTRVSTNRDGDVTYTLGANGSFVNYADEDRDDTVVISGNVAEDDYVTYVKIGNTAYLYATDEIQGVQTRKDQDNKITVSGTVYTLQKNTTATDFNNSNDTFNYYLDQYGYVVATTSTAATTDFAMIMDMYVSVAKTLDGDTPTVEARVMLNDGTVATYEVKLEEVKEAGNNTAVGDWIIKGISSDGAGQYSVLAYDKDSGMNTDAINTWYDNNLERKVVYGYSVSNGVITFDEQKLFTTTGLAEDDVITANISGIAKNTISYTVGGDAIVTNQNTEFVVYNAKDKTAAVYTGSNNLPEFAVGTNGVAVGTVGSNVDRVTASYVFINTASGVEASGTEEYVYIDSTKFVEVGSGDDVVYEYTGTYADGTTVTLTTDDKADVSATGLYEVNEGNEVGDAINLTTANDEFLTEADLTLADGILSVEGGDSYYMTDATLVVYIDEDQYEVNNSKGIVVLETDGSTVTKNVAAIFVTGAAS